MNGAGPLAVEYGEGLGQDIGQLGCIQQGVAEYGDTCGQAPLRRQFMQASLPHAEGGAFIDGGNHQHGNGVGKGLAHGG